MTERPIIFSAPMVNAIIAGTKTQTRRMVKPPPDSRCHEAFIGADGGWYFSRIVGRSQKFAPPAAAPKPTTVSMLHLHCPYGVPGDRLWVRETWAVPHQADHLPPRLALPYQFCVHYAASEERGGLLWRPSIHMPRWASRILLEITAVRVERLQEISEADAIAEGAPWRACGAPQEGSHVAGLGALWESINGPGSWDANPWVWVIEIRRVEP